MVRTTIPRNSNKNSSQETLEDKRFLNFCFFKSISNIFLIWHKFESIYKMYSFVSFETINMANLLRMPLQFFRPNINLDLPKLLLKN